MLVTRGVVETGQDLLDSGIRDLELVQLSDGWAVYTVTGPQGGVAEYRLGAGMTASVADTAYFPASFPSGTGGFGAVIDVNGQKSLVVGADGQMPLVRYVLDPASGQLGQVTQSGLPGLGQPIGATGASAAGGSLLFAANGAAGNVQAFALTPGLAAGGAAVPGGHTGAGDAPVMATLHMTGADFLILASPADNTVTDYRIGPQGGSLTRVSEIGASDGLGISTPSAIASVNGPDGSYLVVASSGSSSLSVLSVGPTGELGVTDHVIDTLNTRFQHVQSLSTVTVGDRVFIAAGGGDGGVTLFTLLPGGRLMTLDTCVDTADLGLGKVQALAAAQVGQEVQVLAAAQGGHGLTQLAFSVSDLGLTLVGGGGADTLQGQSKDDLLAGGAGADSLSGGDGADILFDGSGQDTMTGGAGADTFVLSGDGTQDVITDFQPGVDKLDLSGLYLFSDPGRLSVTQTGDGAVVDWFGDRLVLHRDGGGTITRDEVLAAIIPSADHPYLGELAQHGPTAPIDAHGVEGTAGDDTVVGQAGADIIHALDGNDQIDGGGGADTIDAGAGDDTVVDGTHAESVTLGPGDDLFHGPGGNLGDDTIDAGDGSDTVEAGDGNNLIHGRVGTDSIVSGSGSDRIFGDRGFDTIFSGAGDDTVTGGVGRDKVHLGPGDDVFRDTRQDGDLGRDTVYAGIGNDTIHGSGGDDLFHGENGADSIRGGFGNDSVFGGRGADTLYGGPGSDTVNGGRGRDEAHLGAGNDLYQDCTQGGPLGRDTVYAGAGQDTIMGGAGADNFNGLLGDDLIHGRRGNDYITGGPGDDTLFGDPGDDTILGGTGADKIYGGDGDDHIRGKEGDDLLWGGSGADTFQFRPQDGQDQIFDFQQGQDHIAFVGGVRGMGDLSIHSDGGDAVIDYAGGEITLHGVDAAHLGAGDFLFG